MSLPESEIVHLTERGGEFTVTVEANMTCVVLLGFSIPHGYQEEKSDLLLRLNPGYPDIPPDMWWFNPPLRRLDGAIIPQTESIEQHLGRQWQRWSRHLDPNHWRSGMDTLRTFLAIVRRDLEKYAAPEVVALVAA